MHEVLSKYTASSVVKEAALICCITLLWQISKIRIYIH